MCGTCLTNRKTIKRNSEKVKSNSERMKAIREDKKRVMDNYARKIRMANDKRSKDMYRKQKAGRKATFDQKIDVLRTQNSRLRDENKRIRESIRRRHN